MATTSTVSETLKLSDEQDLVPARQKAKEYAKQAELSITDATKFVTAISELARNMWLYAKGGDITYSLIQDGTKHGVKAEFVDQGPGIENLDLAMQEGYSSWNGMGIGLPGSKRLVSEFDIKTELGKGTQIIVIKWNR